jgi:predicted enzyme related to lactoylglutathione lyase
VSACHTADRPAICGCRLTSSLSRVTVRFPGGWQIDAIANAIRIVKREAVTGHIRHITIDSRDPYSIARFWAPILGMIDDPEDPAEPGGSDALLIDPTGRQPGLLFIAVPEGKTVKNRLHFDLQPAEGRDEAVRDLLDRGALVVDDRRKADGTGWVVMADPEGNEFCVERSAAERASRPSS